MDSENAWWGKDIQIKSEDEFVIEVEPMYGNRKKWEGPMRFRLKHGVLDDLMDQLEERKANKRIAQVAADEMREFIELFKVEYHNKRKWLAEQLNLTVDVIPRPYWPTVDEPDENVEIIIPRR